MLCLKEKKKECCLATNKTKCSEGGGGGVERQLSQGAVRATLVHGTFATQYPGRVPIWPRARLAGPRHSSSPDREGRSPETREPARRPGHGNRPFPAHRTVPRCRGAGKSFHRNCIYPTGTLRPGEVKGLSCPPPPPSGLRAVGGRRWLDAGSQVRRCSSAVSVFLHPPQPDSTPTVTREGGRHGSISRSVRKRALLRVPPQSCREVQGRAPKSTEGTGRSVQGC